MKFFSIPLLLGVSFVLCLAVKEPPYFAVIYADNFLKIGTTLPPNYNIYGLGEHKTSLRLTCVDSYFFFASDILANSLGLDVVILSGAMIFQLLNMSICVS